MKKKYIIKAALFLTIFSTSCQKNFLERYPLDQLVDENYWATEEHLVLAANACYANVKSKNTIDMERMGDNAFQSTTSDNYRIIGSGNFGYELATLNNEWRAMYTAIRDCNVFLLNYNRAESVPVERREEIAGEVRAIRAYLYAYLTLFFGDVPLVTEPLDVDEVFGPRDPAETIQDFILDEFDAAAETLPPGLRDAGNIGRMTKGAALAMKARYALYFGRYAVAEDAAKQVMDLGVYELWNQGTPETTYNLLFTHAGKIRTGNNKETIVARIHLLDVHMHNMSRETQVPDQSTRFSPTKSLVDAYLCSDGLPIDKSPLYGENTYEAIFENRDPRMKQTILAPGAEWGGRSDGNPNQPDINIFTAPKFLNDRLGCVTLTGFYFTKYVHVPAVAQVSRDENDIHLLRYAEVLLTYAEALLEQGKLTQVAIDETINLLRDRVGMKRMVISELEANEMDLREEVRRERRVELALEGQRYFDIKRWQIGSVLGEDVLGVRRSLVMDESSVQNQRVNGSGYIIVHDGRRFVEPQHYLWPVPQTQLDRNPALGQNTGWPL